jgi:hypothetical protein
MSGSIILMEDFRPHVSINTGKDVHVYPISYFHKLASGEEVAEPIPPDVLSAILSDWLMYIGLPVPTKQGAQ